MFMMELNYHNESKYQVNLYSPVIYIYKSFDCCKCATSQTKQDVHLLFPATPPNHLTYISMFNFIYTSPPIFISPFFFLEFFLPCGNYTTDDAARSTNIEASHLAFCKGLWGYCVIFFWKNFL